MPLLSLLYVHNDIMCVNTHLSRLTTLSRAPSHNSSLVSLSLWPLAPSIFSLSAYHPTHPEQAPSLYQSSSPSSSLPHSKLHFSENTQFCLGSIDILTTPNPNGQLPSHLVGQTLLSNSSFALSRIMPAETMASVDMLLE